MRILDKAQAIWPLASDWLSGLKKWIDSPSTSRVYEGVSMTYGVRLLGTSRCLLRANRYSLNRKTPRHMPFCILL